MFDGDKKYAYNNNGQVQFVDFPTGNALSISKLVVPTLNLPVMLHLGFKESRFQFGVGGYVGYRIGGYTKVISSDGNTKEWHHESFQLNDFRYGLTTEFGRKGGFRLFFRYDLSDMFKANQVNAKGIQGWSVGLKLL